MKTALRLAGRVDKLVLLETNPFYLLEQADRVDAFARPWSCAIASRDLERGEWATAAETFADYWGGQGTWRNMSPERRAGFAEALKPNFFEWDAVTSETTSAEYWAALLPRKTLLICDPSTVLPIREIAAILRSSCPEWAYAEVAGGGHMAPLVRPDLINPIVASFLDS
jgi:pimeloyl-ACP methyl ester carboxylesterase